MTTVLAGHKASPFSLAGIDGKRYSLQEALQRGPVVVAFYKISCPVCQYAFPFVERLHQAYGNERVSIWGLSQDNARDTKDFIEEYGLTFPSLLDEKNYPVSNAYGLTNVPTVFLIAPDGQVKVSSNGFSKNDLETISAELARHLKKSPAPVFLPDEIVPDYKPG
jgi:peroxiredoxin